MIDTKKKKILTNNIFSFPQTIYAEVIKIAKELKIPIIDTHKGVFENHKNPLSLFPFGIWGHYNEDGYRLISNFIINQLKPT